MDMGTNDGGGMGRRAVLRAGLALTPVVLVGVWGGKAIRSAVADPQPVPVELLGQSQPSCVVTPQLTEGPYFVDELLFRSDIRSDPSDGSVKGGVPVWLNFRISDVTDGACTALAGAVVDVWQCDALGLYSDVRDPGGSTVGQKFLRGSQYTDENGQAAFTTIYPGWYRGRAVHIHFKVRTDPASDTGYEFTSQLFFDDALTDLVHSREPYAAKGSRDTRNTVDGIFRGGGDQLLLQIAGVDDGYAADVHIGVDRTVRAAGGPGGPGGRPPGPPPR